MRFHLRMVKYDGRKIQWISFTIICESSWRVHLNLPRMHHRTSQDDSHWLKSTIRPCWYCHRTSILYRHTSFFCVLLYCASQILHFFLQIKGKTFHQQKYYDSLSYDTLLWWPPNWQYLQDIHEFTKHSGRQKYLIYWVIPITSGRTGLGDSHHLRKVAPPCWSTELSKVHFSKTYFKGSQLFIKPQLPFKNKLTWLVFLSLLRNTSSVHALKMCQRCLSGLGLLVSFCIPMGFGPARKTCNTCHITDVEYVHLI